MENSFCIFIISHGRPNNIITLKTLSEAGCTIPTYIVIDNHDKTEDQYRKNYTDMVVQFNKDEYAKLVDNFDNFGNLRTTTHARNACFDLAKKLGYKYFLVLDDDYTAFRMRIDNNLMYPIGKSLVIENIDRLFLMTLEYYKSCNFKSICYSQGGDWFGGKDFFNKKPKRKAMNSFFCSVDRRFWFISRLNEDVNTYIELGGRGDVFMTIPFIQLEQKETQKNKGGMSDAYLESGTYVKSAYSVMCRPDSTKINLMGVSNKRLHHLITWKYTVPCIIEEKYKK